MKKRTGTVLKELFRAGIKPSAFFIFLAVVMSGTALLYSVPRGIDSNDFATASILFQSGRDKEALNYAQSSVRRSPSAAAYDLLGSIYLSNNDLLMARQTFSDGVSLFPGDADLHNGLGVAYARSGMMSQAEKEYRAALTIDPAHPNAKNNLGLINR